MNLLPLSWWRLSALWLANLSHRTPPSKRALFKYSVRWAVLGMSLGIAALSVTLAITSGFEWTLSRAVVASSGHVLYQGPWRSLSDLESIASQAPKGLRRFETFWNLQGLMVGPKGGRGVQIEGRRDYPPVSSDTAGESLTESTGESPGESPVVVDVGRSLADYLGVQQGDSLKILLPGLLKGALPVQVRRVLFFGVHEMDSRYVILDDRSLRSYLENQGELLPENRPGDAHGIRFFLGPEWDTPARLDRLDAWVQDYEKRLMTENSLDPNPVLKTWWKQRKNLFGAVNVDKGILSVILSLLTLVAGLNVAAALVILFLERDRELAILRALGMTRSQLVQWIALHGFFIGVTASALGLLLGRFLGWALGTLPWAKLPADIYNLDRLPLHYDFSEQALVFFFGVMASLLMALGLAWNLSRMSLLTVLGHRK